LVGNSLEKNETAFLFHEKVSKDQAGRVMIEPVSSILNNTNPGGRNKYKLAKRVPAAKKELFSR